MSNIKNVEAFEKLAGLCSGYGGSYNPGSPNLTLPALHQLLVQARERLQDVNTARSAYDHATNQREVAFSDLGVLSTRIISALRSSGALRQTVADARTMVRKLQGAKVPDRLPVPSGKTLTENPVGKKRRARGMDFHSRAHEFEKLLTLLAGVTEYKPNEADLQLGKLHDRLLELYKSNSEVKLKAVDWRQTRTIRDQVMATGKDSLYDTSQAVKEYVRSVFGTSSPAFRAVSKLSFTKTT
ncbi:MAG: hypothetical protein K2U26_14475 [Cyclobacteriaceae bacterium]|nr:hypothetical protein [Cyclobacteriaceae bacterium]